MAIGNCTVQSISRQNSNTGGLRNIVSSVAYRSGENIKSIEDDQIKYPHRNREDIENSFILNNPYGTREKLWQEVEKAEFKKNGTIKDNPSWAREILVAIPKELDKEQRLELVKDYSQQIADKYNIPLDVSLHKDKENNGNFHAHILMGTRNIENGELSKTKDRRFNNKESVYDFRNTWEKTTNQHLEQSGSLEKISLQKTDSDIKQIHHYNNPELIKVNNNRKSLQEIEKTQRQIDELQKEKKIMANIINNLGKKDLQAEREKKIDKEIKKEEVKVLKEQKKETGKEFNKTEKKQDEPQKDKTKNQKNIINEHEFYPLEKNKILSYEEIKFKELEGLKEDLRKTDFNEIAKIKNRVVDLEIKHSERNFISKFIHKKSFEKEIKRLEYKAEIKNKEMDNTQKKLDKELDHYAGKILGIKSLDKNWEKEVLTDSSKERNNVQEAKTSVLDNAINKASTRLESSAGRDKSSSNDMCL